MSSNEIELLNESENLAGPHIPGEIGIWVFILGDMLMFGLFFIVFVSELKSETEIFHLSQQVLSVKLGITNTVILLTSSWLVAEAVSRIKRFGRNFLTRFYLSLAWLCGLAFVFNKYIEWSDKIQNDYTLNTNLFFIYYYVLTGIHLLHVLIGLCVLSYLWKLSGIESKQWRFSTFEIGATYWHMVDFLWLILFPLLYILK